MDEDIALDIVYVIFNAATILFILPVIITVLITIARNTRFHSKFHYVISTQLASDFLFVALLCPFSLDVHARNMTSSAAWYLSDVIFQKGVLFTASGALMTSSLLSADRFFSLRRPEQYRAASSSYYFAAIFLIWACSVTLLVCSFFVRSYTTMLTGVLFVLIAVAMTINACVWFAYRLQLRRTKAAMTSPAPTKAPLIGDATSFIRMSFSSRPANVDLMNYQMEERAADTFTYLTLAFLIPNAPVCVACFYSLVCGHTNYVINVVFLLIVANSWVRVAAYILRLTALRKACKNLFVSRSAIERRWRLESVASEPFKRNSAFCVI